MAFKEDYSSDAGWSAVDVSVRLNTAAGEKFLESMRKNNVNTIIRYYASSARPKTLTLDEAKFISQRGFGILPVFQDSSRSISNFSYQSGVENAQSALEFAQMIGQPEGSTIVFAVDADYKTTEIDGPILDYFNAVKSTLAGKFNIGAYGSGAVLSKLAAEGIVSIPWLSMSRLFLGTQQYFYSNRWFLRQIPPESSHLDTGIKFDRNVVRGAIRDLGSFQINQSGVGQSVWHHDLDATLGGDGVLSPRLDVTSIANKIVKTDGLRLRKTANGTVIRELTIGEKVVDVGPASEPGWRRVMIGTEEGVVFGQYLRDFGRSEVEALIDSALAEWLRFDKGRANEKLDPYFKYVREMWAAIGEPYDGRSVYPSGKDVPWSAAYISWVVRKAGPAYANFQFASAHSVFVNNAIKARITGRVDKPFWGYRITEERPDLGDIIQRNRGGGTFNFSYAENHLYYESHSDIVVELTPDVVRVIGGNVSDSVRLGGDVQEYTLGPDGYILPGQGVIAILKNRAGII